MKPGFTPGLFRETTFVITDDMCPAFDGIVVHRCVSTWTLVHQMEIAARKVLVEFLEPHEEGIGAHVSADHLAPCGVGKTVRVRATLAEVSHARHLRVWCDVAAFHAERLLARGRQLQIVMDRDHLRRYLEREL